MSCVSFLLLTVFTNFCFGENVQEEKRILIEDNYYNIISRLDALEKKANQACDSQKTVAFMAYLTKTVSGTNHHIYFDDVKLNLGNGYNPHHGIFVVPVNGTYQFTITACSHGGHYVVLELTVNDYNLGKILAGDGSYDACNSKVFLAQLKAGDDVFVQHVKQGDFLYAVEVYGYPSFTGVLLQAT